MPGGLILADHPSSYDISCSYALNNSDSNNINKTFIDLENKDFENILKRRKKDKTKYKKFVSSN